MTNDFSILEPSVINNNFDKSIIIVMHYIKEVNTNLNITSKEKYEFKTKLIEEAGDMTTNEKLDALDINYKLYNEEVWHNIMLLGVISLSVVGFVTNKTTILNNVRHLIAR